MLAYQHAASYVIECNELLINCPIDLKDTHWETNKSFWLEFLASITAAAAGCLTSTRDVFKQPQFCVHTHGGISAHLTFSNSHHGRIRRAVRR